MKFFGNGIVWDAEKERALCTFEKGEHETVDKRTADILIGLGFENDGFGVLADNGDQENQSQEVNIEEKQPEIVKGVEENVRIETNTDNGVTERKLNRRT